MKELVVIFYITVSSFSVLADTLWLKSGDMLYGHVKLVDNDKLLLDTDYSDTIAIDRNKLKTFSVNGSVEVRKGLFGKEQKAKQVLPGEDGTILLVMVNGDTQSFTMDEKFMLFLNHKKELLHEYLINGKISGGAFYDKGKNKTEQAYFDSQIIARYNLWRHALAGDIRRKTENSKSKTYNYTTSYTLDRFIAPFFFWSSPVSYKRDWIETIKSNFTMGTGPGYELWNNELGSFSLAGLVNYQHLEYQNNDSNTNPLGSIKWNYERYFRSKSFKIFSSGSVGRSIDRSVSLDLTTVFGVSYNFTRWFSANVLFTRDRSKTKDGNSSNTHYGIGLGINW